MSSAAVFSVKNPAQQYCVLTENCTTEEAESEPRRRFLREDLEGVPAQRTEGLEIVGSVVST
mgnify:CR=1 FL=1